jgi:hypothetical protein
MPETHEHLESAEHAEHNAHDPFNQRVAVSMAIVAALLAGISMIGHRTHNRVLLLKGEVNRLQGDANSLQGDVNRLRTEAANAEVEKSNLYAWYQSKHTREEQLLIAAKQTAFLSGGTDNARNDAIEAWTKTAKDMRVPNKDHDSLPELRQRAEDAGKRAEESKAKATTTREEVKQIHQQVEKVTREAEHVHHQANRFDLAHLLSELGLVLCSIALLTKKKSFWFAGILAAVLAVVMLSSGYLLSPDEPNEAAAVGNNDSKGHRAANG